MPPFVVKEALWLGRVLSRFLHDGACHALEFYARDHDGVAAALAFHTEIHARAGDLPKVAAARVLFFHADDVADVVLNALHSFRVLSLPNRLAFLLVYFPLSLWYPCTEVNEMKVSVLQMPVAIGDRDKNEATLRRMLDAAMKDAPDVVVLPELWDVGFFPRPLEDYLDAGGERTKPLLSSLAKSCGVHIVGGSVAVRDGERAANRCYVFRRDGTLIADYDKTHLFSPAKEDRFFRKGDHTAVFQLDGVKCAVAVCYDLRFPELFRRCALEDAAVMFLPAAWPTARIMHWRTLSQARAVENQTFFVAVNGSGAFANGMPLGGCSAIIDPWGERLAEADDGEAILSAALDLSIRDEIKRTIDVFHDRRPELY